MSTEVARAGDNAATAALAPVATAPVATDTTRSLEAWASELTHAYTIATTICNTMFVPAHFRGKPEETAAAILYGYTLGLPPTVSVRSIYSVHGTPALYAQSMYALALSKGHEIERVYADDERVEFRCRRRGQREWQKVEWTIERAKKAKYTSNSKYQENPVGMLTEKCKAEAAKLVAPEALAGLNSVEEIELGDYTPSSPSDLGERAAEDPKPKTKVARKPRAAAPAPELPAAVMDAPRDDEPETVDAEPVDEPALATPAQIAALVAALNAVGHETSAQKKTAIAEQLGMPKSANELTGEEADVLVQVFEAQAGTVDAETGELFDAQ